MNKPRDTAPLESTWVVTRVSASPSLGVLAPLRGGRRDVAAAAERLEHVEVVVTPSRVAATSARLDVVHFHRPLARAAVLAAAAVTAQCSRTRVTPEVVVDEVGAAAIAAPSAPPGGQRAPAPRALADDVRRSFTAFEQQAIDLGHGRSSWWRGPQTR
jgi:hypothetical protein